MKVGEAHALGMQPVEVRRLQDRIAVAGEVAVALVVGEDEDDVRLLPARTRDKVLTPSPRKVKSDPSRINLSTARRTMDFTDYADYFAWILLGSDARRCEECVLLRIARIVGLIDAGAPEFVSAIGGTFVKIRLPRGEVVRDACGNAGATPARVSRKPVSRATLDFECRTARRAWSFAA